MTKYTRDQFVLSASDLAPATGLLDDWYGLALRPTGRLVFFSPQSRRKDDVFPLKRQEFLDRCFWWLRKTGHPMDWARDKQVSASEQMGLVGGSVLRVANGKKPYFSLARGPWKTKEHGADVLRWRTPFSGVCCQTSLTINEGVGRLEITGCLRGPVIQTWPIGGRGSSSNGTINLCLFEADELGIWIPGTGWPSPNRSTKVIGGI